MRLLKDAIVRRGHSQVQMMDTATMVKQVKIMV